MIRILGGTLGLVIGLSVTSAAYATFDQEGLQTQTTTVIGTTSLVSASTFNPQDQECVLYSTLLFDSVAIKQLEAGLLLCRNHDFDQGECHSHYLFIEAAASANSLVCHQGSYFTIGQQYNPYMTIDTFGVASGNIGLATNYQAGFGASDPIRALSWGEAIGLSAYCPLTPHQAAFTNWNKLTSAGWSLISGTIHSNHDIYNAPCWSVSGTNGNVNVN